MKVLVFHRVAIFADALARHLGDDASFTTIDVVSTEDGLGRQLVGRRHDVVLFTRPDLFRCLTQWQKVPEASHEGRRLVLAAPTVFPQLVGEVRPFGVSAVLDVNLPVDQFVSQLREVVAGTRGLPESAPFDSALSPVLETPNRTIAYHDVTDMEIVRLVASGLSDKEITAQLPVSHQTVRNRVSRILRDSQLENRTQLTAIYLRHEFLQLLS